MRKILMTTAVGTALLFGAMSANAYPIKDNGKPVPPPQHHHIKMQKEFTPEMKAKMEQRKAEIEKRLKITDEQKEQLKAVHEKAKAEIAPKITQLADAEFEFEVLQKRQFNQEKYGIATLEEIQLSGKSIDELKNEIRQLRKEIREIKKANFEASQAIFTEKQKKELEKMKKEHQEKMKKFQKKQKGKKYYTTTKVITPEPPKPGEGPIPPNLEQKAYPLEKRAK